MQSWRLVGAAVFDDPFTAYDQVNEVGGFPRYPYPPGFWPALLASLSLEARIGIPLESLIHLPIIAADAGIALLVWSFLGIRGADTRTRLTGAGLVALGPVFGRVSGWHGQFDSVAILPAVAALVLWERPGTAHRAPTAGMLIGLGAAIKTVPGLMLLALLPSARSRREAVTLTAAALAVPLAMLLPLAVAHPPTSFDGGMASILTYDGVPGGAGLNLVVQPGLAAIFLEGRSVAESGVADVLSEYGSFLTIAALLAIAWLMILRRTPPPLAATMLWLVVYVVGYAISGRYFVWGLPFFIMAGYLREAAILQLALTLAWAVYFPGPYDSAIFTGVYVTIMLAVWLGLLVALLRLTRRTLQQPPVPIAAAA